MESLINPTNFYSRSKVVSKPSPVPAENGLYAWFFKEIPGITPTDQCVVKDGLTLLYVGISPGRKSSQENLQKRIKYHYTGNAFGSTLRLTLGVLLADQSKYSLMRVGSGNRMTFTHPGECWLDNWMEKNAFVCWATHPEPWKMEAEIIERVSLPLNIQDNKHHPFSKTLSNLRKEAKRIARENPVAKEDNQNRKMYA
jgi:hypothetical protein